MTDSVILPNGNLFVGCYTKRALLSYMKRSYTSVLDVGCSTGELLDFFKKRGTLTVSGCDISDEARDACTSKGILFEKVDLDRRNLALPYLDNSFDVTICTHVLEHLKYPRIVVREMYRVAKYMVCIVVPAGVSYDSEKHINYWQNAGELINALLHKDWKFSLEAIISKPSDVQLHYASFLVCIYKKYDDAKMKDKIEWDGDHHPLVIYVGDQNEKS